MASYFTDGEHLRYWSPCQVRLYIQREGVPHWIDEAIGVDLQVQVQKTPHFGFRDRFYRRVSYGPTIVSGNLYIHFRYPHYLSHAISFTGPTRANASTNLGDTLSPTQPFDGEDFKKQIIQRARLTANYPLFVEDLKRLFWEGGIPSSRDDPTYDAQHPAEKQRDPRAQPLHIDIRYGDESQDPRRRFLRRIEDVEFLGESHRITVLDGNGDQGLIEMYPFLARRITTPEIHNLLPNEG